MANVCVGVWAWLLTRTVVYNIFPNKLVDINSIILIKSDMSLGKSYITHELFNLNVTISEIIALNLL